MSARSMLRRTALTSAVLAGALVLTACSGSEAPPSSKNTAPSASATASAAPSETSNPAIDTSTTERPKAPEEYTEPQDVAGSYALHATGSLDLLKATTINDAVAMSSAYYTDSFQRGLVGEERDTSFYIVPWDAASANEGKAPTDAFAAVMSTEQTETGQGYVDVRTVVEFDWSFGDQVVHGTRTYALRMVPGTDETGMAWQIDGATGTDAPYNVS